MSLDALDYALVAAGGAAGATLRYLAGHLGDLPRRVPWGTVAVNLARSRWRRAQRLVGFAPRLVEELRDGDPDGHVVLLEALHKLPAGQREVIALHHLADLTVEQVADTLGLPTGTVKARLSRGRAALSTLLVKEGPRV